MKLGKGQELVVDTKNTNTTPTVRTLSKAELEAETASNAKSKSTAESNSSKTKKSVTQMSDTKKPGNTFGLPGVNVDDSSQLYNIRIRIDL